MPPREREIGRLLGWALGIHWPDIDEDLEGVEASSWRTIVRGGKAADQLQRHTQSSHRKVRFDFSLMRFW